MCRLSPLVALLAAASTISASAASSGSGVSVAAQSVSINGVACPEVIAWSGGAAVGSVVVESTVGTAPAKKHLGSPSYEPIVVQAQLPLTAALSDCVADLLAGGTTRRTLQLTNYDASSGVIGSPLTAANALVVELRIPALDAASNSPLVVTIAFLADGVQAAKTATKGAAASVSRASGGLTSGFAVQLAGLDATVAARVEPFVIRRGGGSTAGADALAVHSTATGQPEIPNLVLTLGTTAPADWAAWYDDFVVRGNCDDGREKSGAIELRATDMKSVIFSLQLGHVGITRLGSPPDASGRPGRATCDLYCETMTLGAGAISASAGAADGTASASTQAASVAGASAPSAAGALATASPTMTPIANTPLPTVPMAPNPVGPPAAAAGTITSTPVAPAVTVPPVAAPRAVTSPAPAAIATAPVPAVATAPVTSPEDKGARDPADFPRPNGTVRTSYQATRQKGWVQENAGYTAEMNSEAIVAFYEKALTAAGWEETSRNENNYAVESAHQIVTDWQNDNRVVTITIIDDAPGHVQIALRLEVTTKL